MVVSFEVLREGPKSRDPSAGSAPDLPSRLGGASPLLHVSMNKAASRHSLIAERALADLEPKRASSNRRVDGHHEVVVVLGPRLEERRRDPGEQPITRRDGELSDDSRDVLEERAALGERVDCAGDGGDDSLVDLLLLLLPVERRWPGLNSRR